MANFALINTVTPSAVIKRAVFDEAPQLAEAKGLKWILDNPPSFDSAKQTRTESATVPVDATEVPYTVSDIPLETIKKNWKAMLRARFEARGQSLVSGYAPSERETWAEQSKAAEDYVANPNADHSYLSAMVKDGETVADLAALILANRAALQVASASIIKVRREIEAAIDAASTADEVLSVNVDAGWPF